MRKPAVGLGAVPVLDACRDHHDGAGDELSCSLALLLVPPLAGGADQNLTATALRMVYVPVVATSRLESHVEQRELAVLEVGQGVQEALAAEVLRERSVGIAFPEHVNSVEFGLSSDAHAIPPPYTRSWRD